jgi:cyclopropane-fatty-acyl-phospholipid synthase
MARLPQVRALGFDERFIRMWEFYLAYCEGAFLERHISDVQLFLAKNHNPRPLLYEPWASAADSLVSSETGRELSGRIHQTGFAS